MNSIVSGCKFEKKKVNLPLMTLLLFWKKEDTNYDGLVYSHSRECKLNNEILYTCTSLCRVLYIDPALVQSLCLFVVYTRVGAAQVWIYFLWKLILFFSNFIVSLLCIGERPAAMHSDAGLQHGPAITTIVAALTLLFQLRQ